MILEGVVTTLNVDGSLNVAPMGPVVDEEITQFELKPFRTATTYANLNRTRCGVLHITDDVLLIARSVAHAPFVDLATVSCEKISGQYLADACRIYEFSVEWIDDSQNRSIIKCRTVKKKLLREFFGFNRAKHAVLEAAILATRIDFLPGEELRDQFQRLQVIVQKTGGDCEQQAFQLLDDYVKRERKENSEGESNPS